jgi:hypothetical protein
MIDDQDLTFPKRMAGQLVDRHRQNLFTGRQSQRKQACTNRVVSGKAGFLNIAVQCSIRRSL